MAAMLKKIILDKKNAMNSYVLGTDIFIMDKNKNVHP